MKKSVLMIFAAALLVSCASSELINPNAPTEVDGPDAIVLKSSHIDAVTRMPYTGAISETNPLPARVLGATASSKYQANQHVDGTMIFKGGITTFERGSVGNVMETKYPAAGDLFLCGLAPSGKDVWSVDGDNVASITIKGKEDVMAAGEVTTSKASAEAGEIPSLTFSHLLTKLEVSLKAASLESPAVWGKVTQIELITVDTKTPPANKVVVSLKEGTATFSGAGAPTFYGMSKTNNSASYTEDAYDAQDIPALDSKVVAYSMIAPFEAVKGSKKLVFNIYTEYTPGNKPNKVEVDLDFDGDTAGRAFGITFLFPGDSNAIIGTATVIDWINSGEVTAPVE